jgi:hypothetical protein
MKRLIIAAVGLALVVGSAACTRTVERVVVVTATMPPLTATPVPRYTSEEVITLVSQADAPWQLPSGALTVGDFAQSICGAQESEEHPVVVASFEARYLGNSRWEVTSWCMGTTMGTTPVPMRRMNISPGTWRFLEDRNEVIPIYHQIGEETQ